MYNAKHDLKLIFVVVIGFVLLMQTQVGYAATMSEILINVQRSLWPLWKLVNAVAYFVGIALFFKGMYHLKIYGELRTMMASQTSLKQPLAYFGFGAAFIFLPTTIDIALTSTYGDSNIMPYSSWVGASATKYSTEVVRAAFALVQFIGGIALVRGMLLLVKSVKQGAQGQFGKGMTHIIGGIMGLNIVGTANILESTLGIGFLT